MFKLSLLGNSLSSSSSSVFIWASEFHKINIVTTNNHQHNTTGETKKDTCADDQVH